ncbi:MAG: hypothetical protein K0R17_2754 [Rariglobus sp.]|jgi:hypothetical protein|nr:hypothetical protein [Rariglobus sp.]
MADAGEIVLESPPSASAQSEQEAAAPRHGPARYDFPYEHYLPIFRCSLRTLKNWVGAGREVQPADLPPLDNPELMANWYARRMKNRVPDHLVALAAKVKASASESTKSTGGGGACGHVTTPAAAPIDPTTGPLFAAAAKSSTSSTPRPPAVPAHADQLGYVATLQRLRNAEQVAGARYVELAQDPDKQSEAEQARRAWSNIVKELRAFEKDSEQVLRASGELWLKSDVIKANTEIHLAIRDGLRGLIRRVRPKLVGLTDAESDRLWGKEVDGLFSRLRATAFTSPAVENPAETAAAA